MSRYEERLDGFAQGRRFALMSRPVRNRADSWCDACGSVQARILFGLKDEASEQVYFVGSTVSSRWRSVASSCGVCCV